MKDKHITIYTILMTTKYELAGFSLPDFGDSRIVGFYENLEDAVSAVTENWGDIHEYYYEYAIIEKVEEGLYNSGTSEDRKVFKWDSKAKAFKPIKDLKEFDHLAGFTIG